MSSLVRSSNLRGYAELVHELGGDPASLLRRFHLPATIEQQDNRFVSYRNVALLLEASATELGCPDFGLRLSRWQGLRILGPIAVIARNADTVREAFGAIARFLYVHSPALRMSLEQPAGEPHLRLVYEVTERGLPPQRQGYELAMANGVQILRLLAGAQARPAAVFFMHARIAPDAAYREVFGCRVHFKQQWCGVHLPAAIAARRIDSADSQTRALATTYLESQHEPGKTTLHERVCELIRRLLPTGLCSIEAIAEQLAMHPRTLQRRLAEGGQRYDELLDDERRALAQRYLSQSGLYLSQITGLLGYAEQSTFNRSCQRWFGTTPRRYRAQAMSLPQR